MRRVTLIEEMFLDVASREEKLKVDELYRLSNKGSAIVFMLKRIRAQWNVFVGKSSDVTKQPRKAVLVREKGQERYIAIAR